jgi:hypothetical protein
VVHLHSSFVGIVKDHHHIIIYGRCRLVLLRVIILIYCSWFSGAVDVESVASFVVVGSAVVAAVGGNVSCI